MKQRVRSESNWWHAGTTQAAFERDRNGPAPRAPHGFAPQGPPIRGEPTVRDVRQSARLVLQLTLGWDGGVHRHCDWDEVLRVAFVERCAVLAWHRSGPEIRACAPRSVVARWRALAVQAAKGASEQLDGLRRCVDALETAGLHPVILKGLPLSQQLYGDPCVRVATDIDVYLPARERQAGQVALARSGWALQYGTPPFEQLFALAGSGHCLIEVQSTILSDRLAHYAAPSAIASRVMVTDASIPCLASVLQPIQLAVHLAKHQLAPLLWWIDFATLWASLDEDQRGSARAAARSAGLTRYLAWALNRSHMLEAAADGDSVALAAFGITAQGRSDAHSIWRDIALAPSVGHAVAAAADWVWPRATRTTSNWMVAEPVRRLKLRWAAAFFASQGYRDG